MNAIARIETHTHHSSSLEDLENEITQLASNINAANYQLLVLIAEFDDRKGWASWGAKSCAYWLNWRCGIGMGAAREKVRVANALRELPKVSAAFADGRLSYSKARAITRIADSDNEDSLLMIAEHGSASHVENTVRQYKRVTMEQAQAAHNERSLHYHWDDGNLCVRATLSAEQGALFLKALGAVVDVLDQDEWKTGTEEVEADKYVSAETLPETVAQFAPEKPERRANKRADAFALMAETQLQHMDAQLKTADRYQVVVHADATALAEETVKRLCCDASVSEVGMHNGEPVSIGRKSRAIPAPMRRALQHRDGGCRFPGCNSTRFVDGHHIRHWSEGGETSLQNLVLLCRHHHRLVHEGGYSVARSVEGEIRFYRPDGALIPDAPEPVNPRSINQVLQSQWFWKGDRMDYGLAIDGLLCKAQRANDVSAETFL